jgi:uncharacterized coiled-coil DUF342 family protein
MVGEILLGEKMETEGEKGTLGNLEEKIDDLLKEFQELKKERDELAAKLDMVKKRMNQLENRIELLSKDREKVKTRIDQLLHHLKGLDI